MNRIPGEFMERKVSVSIYVGAFLLSLFIFVLGVYIGSLIDNSNLNLISQKVTNLSNRVSSVNVLLLMDPAPSSCPLYLSELDSLDSEIETIGHKLAYLEDEKNVFDDDLKRNYFVLEAESLVLTKKINSVCQNNSRTILINFYSNKNCANCKSQGIEILKARDELSSQKNLKLFSFDGDLGSAVVDSLKSSYNVTTYPSIVIQNNTYSGYKSQSQIVSLIRESK